MDRFWGKVSKTSSCWFWTAAKRDGYGVYWTGKANESAHRYIYKLKVGPIPDDKQLDHLCMNRNCVNPEHLEVVDHATNLDRRRNSFSKPQSPNVKKKLFLLYIHDPRFKQEKRKSELVNKLLAEHYSPLPEKKEPVQKNPLPLTYKPTNNWGA